MPESHKTREFIGGGELVPQPETAGQTHGRHQPFETPAMRELHARRRRVRAASGAAAQTHGWRQLFETSARVLAMRGLCHG